MTRLTENSQGVDVQAAPLIVEGDSSHEVHLASTGGMAESLSDAVALPPKIAAIIERLHTQDNRITSHPLFAVQQRRRIYGVDEGYSEGVVWVGEEGEQTDADVDGARELGYVDKWEFVTGCMTEQGCKDFIACNGHNLHKPRIYAYSAYRNAEFIALREWLMSLQPPTDSPPHHPDEPT